MAGEGIRAVLSHVWSALEPLGFPYALMGGIALAAWNHPRGIGVEMNPRGSTSIQTGSRAYGRIVLRVEIGLVMESPHRSSG